MNFFNFRHTSAADRHRLINWLQNCFPGRLKGLLFSNPPWFFRLIFGMIRPFMKAKLQERVVSIRSADDFVSWMPLDALPEELGGTLQYPTEHFIEFLRSDAMHPSDLFP